MKILAERLKELRKECKISQDKLGNIINVTDTAIMKWEQNKADPTATNLKNLSIFFNVSSDYLIGLENYDGSKVDIKSPNITPITFTPEEAKPRMIRVCARSKGNKIRNLELSEDEIRKIQASRIRKITDDDDI